MKFGAIVVVVLVLSAVAAHFLLGDPGYVAITFRGYLVEMSVPVLIGIAVLLILIVWLIRRIIQAPRLIGEAAGWISPSSAEGFSYAEAEKIADVERALLDIKGVAAIELPTAGAPQKGLQPTFPTI